MHEEDERQPAGIDDGVLGKRLAGSQSLNIYEYIDIATVV